MVVLVLVFVALVFFPSAYIVFLVVCITVVIVNL